MTEALELYAAHPAIFAAIVAFFGALVGSFLNVVACRLPARQQWESQLDAGGEHARPMVQIDGAPPGLLSPASHCPRCLTPIKPWHNIPIAGWFLIGGRCASCRAPVSFRYPLIELLTAVVSGALALHVGVTAPLPSSLIVLWSLIALALIDHDTQTLPDVLTQPLLWWILAASAMGWGPIPPGQAIMGAMWGYLAACLAGRCYYAVTGQIGLGGGDYKLFAALGALSGASSLWPAALLAGLSLTALALTQSARARLVPAQPGTSLELPFGPHLALAGIANLFGAHHWFYGLIGLPGW